MYQAITGSGVQKIGKWLNLDVNSSVQNVYSAKRLQINSHLLSIKVSVYIELSFPLQVLHTFMHQPFLFYSTSKRTFSLKMLQPTHFPFACVVFDAILQRLSACTHFTFGGQSKTPLELAWYGTLYFFMNSFSTFRVILYFVPNQFQGSAFSLAEHHSLVSLQYSVAFLQI